MTLRPLIPLVCVLAGCHARPESLVPASVSAQGAPTSDYLRDERDSFVVLGDSTSFVWPALLQDLLDAHAGKRGQYRVLNVSVPETGIGAWTDAGEHPPLGALADQLRNEQRTGARTPKTALCLVSLRGLCDESGPVKSENDMVGAEMGADALERLALELHRLGLERVVFGTPLFADGAGPERGLEHVALERLLARGHAFVKAGPDVFRASRRYFPDAFEDDRVHPNEFGAKLVAEEWYRWLAGPEAREGAVEGLYARDYDVEAIEASHAERLPLKN